MNLTWEAGRQLSTLQKGDTSVSYTYNADGTRIGKTVNGRTKNYLWDGGKLLSQTSGSDTQVFLYHGDSRIALEFMGQLYYYLYNLQGDVVGLVDKTGTTMVTYTYDVWGKPESTTGPMATTLGVANPFRYRGYYYDTESGFYYLQSRYYDPEVGRFLNADETLGANRDVTAYNLYAYCSNNPVMYADPGGEASVLTIVIAIMVHVTVDTIVTQIKKEATKAISNSDEPQKIDNTYYQYGIRYVNQLPNSRYFVKDYWGSYSSDSGCAVASVSMALYSLGYDILPSEIIKNNGGTVRMYWGKQGVKFDNKQRDLNMALDRYLNDPNKYAPPVVNINNNTHWVTVVGYDGAGGYRYIDPDGTRKWKNYNWSYGTIIQYHRG